MIDFEACFCHRQRQELSNGMQWAKSQQNRQLYFKPGQHLLQRESTIRFFIFQGEIYSLYLFNSFNRFKDLYEFRQISYKIGRSIVYHIHDYSLWVKLYKGLKISR